MSFDLKIFRGDLQISSTGDLAVVSDTEKLIQDMLKIIMTPLGGNPFFPWYGSGISKTIIGSPLTFQLMNVLSENQVKKSLETLQKIQKEQAKQGQKMTAAEMLAAIQEVKIEQNQTDSRYFRVIIKAFTKALTPATTALDISPIL